LNTVISEVLALLEHQFEIHRIKVRRELHNRPIVVSGIEHKLQQVFLNLFLNAKDAMPKGGWLSVSTRVEDGNVIVGSRRYRLRHSERVSRADLRSLLHDESDRPGHGSGAVNHLWDRAGTRRIDRL
jgi:signal transduction histidine kinase